MRAKTYAVAGALCVTGVLLLGGCQSWRQGLALDNRCEPVTAEIYFEPDSAELGPEARGLIAETARRSSECVVEAVEVLGLADASGAADANLVLSQARAAAVAEALTAAGLPEAAFDTRAAGQAGAVTTDGVNRPMRRRVEIVLRMANPS
ncbi:MAG: OmpA family protein [Phenylobacterium sp.]|uniref:OmpA family protein n=1 Tax=Phenylobacterium sp. TaxID=1871053 RepID=UPI00272469FA|nr:OmpA family protein [Phenylobacterium sp.]MDO8901077.1 OmpA family protein [Phenylobacterium sp.]